VPWETRLLTASPQEEMPIFLKQTIYLRLTTMLHSARPQCRGRRRAPIMQHAAPSVAPSLAVQSVAHPATNLG
jgi:hypothetical protein